MKTPLLGCLLFFSALAFARADRDITALTNDWKFIKQDAGVAAPADAWESVTLPHTWNARDAQEGPDQVSDRLETPAEAEAATAARTNVKSEDPHLKSRYYRGACWYDRSLQIPAEWKGKKRVFIRFGAAGTVARTHINGTLLGEHRGGFTAFCYELTDYLNYGGTNDLRVQVDNTHREDLPPLSGDFNLDGGLYRQAELIVTDEFCISPLDYASPGVYLTTKSLTGKGASVEVLTLVSNGNTAKTNLFGKDLTPGKDAASTQAADQKASARATAVTMVTEIKDAAGNTVARDSSEQSVSEEETVPVKRTLSIPNPHRWNGRKDPYLYAVTVSLLRDGTVVDQVVQNLGLRTVAITQEKGFLLNGEPYPVHGVNRHQDVRGKGWAISAEDEENDARLMKEMGVTAVRNAHYPQSDNWHRINDREGVLLWDEVSLVNETRSARAFWANSEECLREMVHQLYNHPSIAWWGIFNELGNRSMPPSDAGLARLQSIAKEIDSSRMVVSASCHPRRSFNLITEQIGLNVYPGWYDKKPPSEIAEKIESFSKEVGKRIGVSEYGAGANIAHHAEGELVQPPHKGAFHPEEWQAYVHESEWAAMQGNPKLWGTFVWNMFDFACQGRSEGNTPALNDKGLVTHDRRFRKDAFFFYKANWNPEPMVHIASARMSLRRIATTEVKVYSNCGRVDLKVNGKLVGTSHPDAVRICRFPGVTLSPGKNSIEAIGDDGQGIVGDGCDWVLEPEKAASAAQSTPGAAK